MTLFQYRESNGSLFAASMAQKQIGKRLSNKTLCRVNHEIGIVAERVKALFLRQPRSHGDGFNPHPCHVFASLDKKII